MAGHHHHNGHHHHHHDDKQGGEDGTRITLIGAALNVVLTVSKLVAGRWTHSPSLVADAFHSASDLIADCITFVTYSWSRKPRDAHYPLGYHKYETVGSLTISVILVSTSIGLVMHALHLGSADHHDDHGSADSFWPIAFILVSLVVKESLYRTTRAIALKQKSDVLLANAQHHRSDALGSLLAGLAIIASRALKMHNLDSLGGVAVAAMIAKEAVPIGLGACAELVDRVDPAKQRLLVSSVEDALDVRKAGSTAFVKVKGKPRKVDTASLLELDGIAEVWVSFADQ